MLRAAGDSQDRKEVTPCGRLARLLGLTALAAAFVFAQSATPQISSQAYLAEVKYLASPQLKGRATGSPELEKAATYISGLYKSFGLKPVNGNGYEQGFTVTVNAHPGPENHLNAVDGGAKSVLA